MHLVKYTWRWWTACSVGFPGCPSERQHHSSLPNLWDEGWAEHTLWDAGFWMRVHQSSPVLLMPQNSLGQWGAITAHSMSGQSDPPTALWHFPSPPHLASPALLGLKLLQNMPGNAVSDAVWNLLHRAGSRSPDIHGGSLEKESW